MNNIVRRNLSEERAKTVYNVYAGVMGISIAWEKLTPKEMTAWLSAVEFLQADPGCDKCGEGLLCIDCDTEAVFSCPECSHHPVLECPVCNYKPELPK